MKWNPYVIAQLVGGPAVLVSYVAGIWAYPEHAEALWGELPAAWVPAYVACMPFAAVGYLVASAYVLKRMRPRLGIAAAYAVFLAGSTLWMPLSLVAIDLQSTGLAAAVQVDLAVVAAAALVIAGMLYRQPTSRFRTAAGLGWFALCWQTVVLDALIWPRFFVVG